jgi:hypothetical protein
VNAELWIAVVLSIAVGVQLWTGAAWVGRRSLYERWLHDDDDEQLIWRSHDTFYYWCVIALEGGAAAVCWWRGFT